MEKNLPHGVESITWKDGSTTYQYQGQEYNSLDEVPVKTSKVLNKIGEKISQNPIVQKVAPALEKFGEYTSLPGEEFTADQVGLSFQKYGLPYSVGQSLGYVLYPGFGELKAPTKGLSALQPAFAGGQPKLLQIGVNDGINPGKPLMAASDPRLSPTNPRPWSQIAERAIEGDRIKTAELLKTSSPTYNKLSKRNQYIKINELAEDPDFILDLVDRNKQVGETFKEYIKALSLNEGKKAGTIGRSLNDIASKNPLDPSTIIYGNKSIRDTLKNKFVEFTGQEWHHVFGSKEIGETMLTKISGEPMMAANIFKFLDDMKVPTSGTAQNMALMSKAKHTGKGTSYHDWAKQTGFEPWTNPASSLEDLKSKGRLSQQLTGEKRLKYKEGKFTAPLDFPDLMKSVSESILKGTAEADEFMDMLRVYAKSVRPHILQKLKEFDARIVSEIEGVERVILDKPYKSTLGTRRKTN